MSVYELWKKGTSQGPKKPEDSIRATLGYFRLGNPNSIVKMAANLLGYPVGPCRSQRFWSEDPAVEEEIARVLKSTTRAQNEKREEFTCSIRLENKQGTIAVSTVKR